MIKLIIFDLSGVCFTNEEPPYIIELCKKYDYNHKEFDELYQSMLVKAEVGKLTGEEVWSALIEKYNIPKTIFQIVDEMMELKEAKLDTLGFASNLKNKVITVYLTNYCKLYWDAISSKFDMSRWFSDGFVSYQLGFRKPARQCFEIIMKKYKIKAEEIIFIDDSLLNLKEAISLGIKAIIFKDINQLKKELINLGIKA